MKKKNSFVTTGIVSLFLIFSVLCLVILSLLSLGTSRSDYTMSEQTLTGTCEYYEACSQAARTCLEIEDFLYEIWQDSRDASDYYEKINTFSIENTTWRFGEQQLLFEIPFSAYQSLIVSLDILYPDSSDDPLLSVNTWKTAVTGTWNPDTTQPVYQGDELYD